ncbi:Gfo/Idh/MocA family protein [Novipirellula artificiosorum]|uniref:Putative oxidoreductase YcjS n=1 Tax=Novipirellula artificiosorum TaxID=2528016 RepID=A0A5C6D214_9BACT|nr:Gfo/Idh/MocA family oxidoreductase [Novipirellula artificiosorum]TWU30870.1 putative oxidoreductase YcjS [Novipirellula artificiosorum]
MWDSISRRFFLRGTAAAAGALATSGLPLAAEDSPNNRLQFASIGVGGKGDSDSKAAANHGEMVAVCDVDRNRLANALKHFPNARGFTDYREMLDQMGNSIDAVTVSTPDHMHAPASLMAMRMGIHCFCQKPLTRTIYEARLVGQVAREKKLATQMGNQGTASDTLRQCAHWLRGGAIGSVKELHIWTNRAKGWWPQGIERPPQQPTPAHLDWDAWLGVAAERPYGDGYHPFKWRGWWDFGTGALGDIACHVVSMPFMGLDLRDPLSAVAETSGHNGESFPESSIITFEFGANPWRGPVKLVWYDGGRLPPKELLGGREPGPEGGSLAIGDKGILLNDQLLDGAEPVQVEFPHSPGHVEEWIRAIRGGEQAMSNFPDYAGPLTEVMLLGNLAVWTGQKVEWNAAEMAVSNIKGLDTLIKPTYRNGYTLDT